MAQQTDSESRIPRSRRTPLQPAAYSQQPRRRPAAAFTLIELLIVIAIIMILAGLAIASIPKLFESAKVLASKTRMQDVTRRLQGMGTGSRSPATLIIDTMTTYPVEFRPLESVVSVLTAGYGLRLEPVRSEHQSGYGEVSASYATGDENHLGDWDRLPPDLYSIAEYDEAWYLPANDYLNQPYRPYRRKTMIGQYAVGERIHGGGYSYCTSKKVALDSNYGVLCDEFDITAIRDRGEVYWISPYTNPTAGLGGGRAKTLATVLMRGRFTNYNISQYAFCFLGADPWAETAVYFVDPFLRYDESMLEMTAVGLLPQVGEEEVSSKPINIQWQSRRPEHALRAHQNSDGTLCTRHGWTFDWAGESLRAIQEVSPPAFEDALERLPPSERGYYEDNPHELAWTRQQYLEQWPLYVEVKADPHYAYGSEYDDDVGNVLSESPYLYSFAWQPSDWDREEPGDTPPLWSMPWGRYLLTRGGESIERYQRIMFPDGVGDVPDMSGADLSTYAADPDSLTDDFPEIRRRTLADLSPVYTIRLLELAEILPQENTTDETGGKFDFRRDRSDKRPFNDAWGNPLVVGVAGCLAPRYGPYPADREHTDGILYTKTRKNPFDPGSPATSLEFHEVEGAGDMLPKAGERDYLKHRFKEVYGSDRFAYLSVGALGPQRGVYGSDNPIETTLSDHGLGAFDSIEPLKWQASEVDAATQEMIDRQVMRACWLQVTELCEAHRWDDASFQDPPWDQYHKGFDPHNSDIFSTIIEPAELE